MPRTTKPAGGMADIWSYSAVSAEGGESEHHRAVQVDAPESVIEMKRLAATLGDCSSPRRPGRQTQRIKARLLFIAQRTVEFRERRLHGLHRAKRGVEPPLHRLDPTRGGERLVGRATDLKAFRRLDGGILQFVECGALHRRGLDCLADA